MVFNFITVQEADTQTNTKKSSKLRHVIIDFLMQETINSFARV